MNIMEFIKTVQSKTDNVIKYIFKTDDKLIIEFSYINKDDGKDIICIPAQSMCTVGCKFCHTLEYVGKIKCRNLTDIELLDSILYIVNDLKLESYKRTLLISIMGCGEVLYNVQNIIDMMTSIKHELENDEKYKIPFVRFAIATSIPEKSAEEFFKLTFLIKDYNLPVKIHLSLHYTFDLIRKDWIPKSLDIIPSLSAVDFYKKVTGNAVEIHYTLISGINDTEQDAILLSNFLKDKNMNVKFLFFNEKESIDYHASNKEKLNIFRKYLDKYSISHEYYIPPGLDIGSSCGAFLMDYYLEQGLDKI